MKKWEGLEEDIERAHLYIWHGPSEGLIRSWTSTLGSEKRPQP